MIPASMSAVISTKLEAPSVAGHQVTKALDVSLGHLPPLPPITDQDLLTTALTHKSMVQYRGHTEDYEKLAHFGDSLLGMSYQLTWHQPADESGTMVTSLIRKIHPELEKGPATVGVVPSSKIVWLMRSRFFVKS
jgi:hypothetical protein